MKENSDNKGFMKGIAMSLFGWFLTTITTPIVATVMIEGSLNFESITDLLFTGFTMLYGGILLIIWGPAAWIIANAYRKKGYQKALILTISIYAISMLVFFGCTNLIRLS